MLVGVAVTVILLFVVVAALTVFSPSNVPAPRETGRFPVRTGAGKPVHKPPKVTVGDSPKKNASREYKPIDISNLKEADKTKGTIRGMVYGETGEPIPLAKVTVIHPANLPPNHNHNYSGEDGSYVLTELPPDNFYKLEAEKEGYATAVVERIEVKSGFETMDVDIMLKKGFEARITVVDENREPIEGVLVRIIANDPHVDSRNRFHSVKSGLDGLATFTGVLPGDYSLRASHPAYINMAEPLILVVSESGVAEETIRLVKGGIIKGRVVDDENNPVSKVSVWVAQPRADNNSHRVNLFRMGRTDDNGSFIIQGIASGEYMLQARMNGYLEPEKKPISITEGTEITGEIITLSRGLSISGHVLDLDGDPISGANVMAVHESSYSSAKSDEEGRFVLTGLKEASFRLSVTARDYLSSKTYDNIPAGSTDVILKMARAAEINGFVSSAFPVDSFVVKLFEPDLENPEGRKPVRQQYFRYGNDGAFKMKFVQPGQYWIHVTHRDHEPGPDIPITVGNGEVIEGIRLEMGPKRE